jgi:hypothetical protein
MEFLFSFTVSTNNHSDKHVLGKCLGLSGLKYLLKKKRYHEKSTSLFKHLRALSLKIKEKKEKKNEI